MLLFKGDQVASRKATEMVILLDLIHLYPLTSLQQVAQHASEKFSNIFISLSVSHAYNTLTFTFTNLVYLYGQTFISSLNNNTTYNYYLFAYQNVKVLSFFPLFCLFLFFLFEIKFKLFEYWYPCVMCQQNLLINWRISFTIMSHKAISVSIDCIR